MWLGATLSTLLHVGSIVLFFIGLSVVALALSTDKKEPETVDTNMQTGARKVEAPAKTKSKTLKLLAKPLKGKRLKKSQRKTLAKARPVSTSKLFRQQTFLRSYKKLSRNQLQR
jgi:hypothetical protein